MATSEKVFCKLPLLDGNVESSPQLLAVDSVSGNVAERLHELYRRDSAVFKNTLCTAWSLLLRCYAGQDCVSFRLESSGASLFQLDVQRQEPLLSCLERALTSSSIPNDDIIPQEQRTNTTVLIRYANGSVSSAVERFIADVHSYTTREKVTLLACLTNEGLKISLFAHSTDVSFGYLKSLANTLEAILNALVFTPELPLQELDYTRGNHMEQLQAWTRSPIEQVERCIHDIVYEQSLLRPDHEAVCAWDGSMTYSDLWRHVRHLAPVLCDMGVGPEVVVPLCFEKSIWSVVAMLAVMEAGGAFCPLDATQPNSRLKALVLKLDAKILLCSRIHTEKLSSLVSQVLPIDGQTFNSLSLSSKAKLTRASPTNIAYVLWTSGSTGEPKGIIIEHRAYCSGAKAHAPAYHMYSDSRVLQYSSYVFDASLIETLTPLMLGATMCIPSEQSRFNDLPAAMNQLRVNWAVLTPSVVSFLAPSLVPGLKSLLLVGEVMSQDHISTWSCIGLVNGYGPAECSVAATANPEVSIHREPTLIGRGIGARCWLVDPEDHNRLAPPGCAAELVIEGPTLARGYLGEPERTKQAFIEDPAWAIAAGDRNHKRRMYKTGDLVRYHTENGMMYFLGRKDTQVKLHGQRIELGEIEHHLGADPAIQQSMVILPKSGPLSQRLVGLMCLDEASAADRLAQDVRLQLVGGKDQEKVQSMITHTQERLARQLPAFMIPSVWLVVRAIPLLKSGKLDRKSVLNWVHGLKEEDYSQLFGPHESEDQPATELEGRLRSIWGHVLNFKPSQVGLQRSFLSLGGDSISAMMVQSQCKKENIGITVQDILRAKSISHLATLARKIGQSIKHLEKIEEDFDLAPIQSLYFELPNRGKGHFNQSFFVRLARKFRVTVIHQAVKAIINRHSMLRARFRLSAFDDEWKQRITTDVAGSYSFNDYVLVSREEAVPIMSKSQASLDPVNGPLFSVDVFAMEDGSQLLFLTAHHLVVDLVSWRVILQDLEDILTNPKGISDTEPSFSFQAWSKMQVEHSHSLSLSTVLPAVEVPTQDYAYWGMQNRPNLYGDVEHKGFELDAATTALIVAKSHQALRTDTVDMLIATMIYSYSQVFTDREPATVFNEGHGREVWDETIDLSRTIGWFTTMYPVHVTTTASADFIDVLRRVKDFRRSVPANGRHYFASRLLTSKGGKRFGRHWPLELTFNYLGIYQQLERQDALLLPVEEMAGEARGAGGKADVGFDTPRFGLFEISAVVAQGKLRFSFTYNRHMKHQDRIKSWIDACRDTLATMPKTLVQTNYQPTLSDFPLLSLTYKSLEQLVSQELPRHGISELGNVEDIYTCSQIQQGLLISTQKDAGFYAIKGLYKVNPNDGALVDSNRIMTAWQKVVNRHPSLRTIFVDSLSEDDALYDQIVLRNVTANVVHLTCDSETDVARTFGSQSSLDYDQNSPAHRLTVCQTSTGEVFCKVEFSHTIVDGTSISIIFQELVSIYEGQFLSATGPLYSNYIAFLQKQPLQAGIGYWKSYLAHIEPSTFPVLNDAAVGERELHSKRLNFHMLEEIQGFCNIHGVTMANIFHTAWALTIQCYTGSHDVCYGYLMSTRDPAVEGAEDLVGYLVNMLVCRVILDPDSSLVTIMQQVQMDLSDGQAHRHTALSEVLHTLDLGGDSLFNTSLSYRKLPPTNGGRQHAISFDEWSPYYDPTEYSLSINIEVSDDKAAIDLDYWTDCLSDGHAGNVLNTFTQALENIIDYPESRIGQMSILSKADQQQILVWNSDMPESINRCVHEVVAEQTVLRPSMEAIRGWDADFTYSALEYSAGSLATYLSLYGVRPETYVCLCFEKSAYTIVAMLGVLQAGGAFVSLDAMNPIDALKLRIEDTATKVVLTSPCYSSMFDGMGLHVVSIDAGFLDSLKSLNRNRSAFTQPHHPFCVIYTSGSTGRPKGVVIEHRAMVTSAEAHGSKLGIGTQSRFLQFASYTFDNNLEEIFTTLMRGGVVCVPSEHERMNDLAGAVQRLQANFMDMTPTVATYLNPSEMPSIKGMALGGEALTKTVLEVWGDKVDIHNQYGPSECTINAAHRTDIFKSSDPSSIGRSVGSVSWIVDPSDHNRLLPIGREGELLIEGPILARGYLNLPEKTAEVFIDNPEWAQPNGRGSHAKRGSVSTSRRGSIPNSRRGSITSRRSSVADNLPRRMYKTGDLVRYNSDGTISYLGRKDQQVKLHGQRIELGEIEYHVREYLDSNLRFAIELIIPGDGGESSKCLAVFVCPQTDDSVSATVPQDGLLPVSTSLLSTFKDLEASLTQTLPKHMVPSMYIPCVRLPLTSSGKLDRKQLRTTAKGMNDTQVAMCRLSGSSGREPSTEVEKVLAGLWESILHLGPGSIGMDAQFFRMGGDSIAAIRLVTAARSKGISLTVANIFQNGTLSEMCRTASTADVSETDAAKPGPQPFEMLPPGIPTEKMVEEVSTLCRLKSEDIEDIYPCTTMQEGLMALSSKQSGAYCFQNVYSLVSLDVARFKAAWEAVLSTEPILRTRIVYTDSMGFLQVVVKDSIQWQEENGLSDLAKVEKVKPSYNGGELAGFAIIQNSDRAFFVLTMHHALYDGWSLDIVLDKVRKCYEASTPSKAATDRSYADFIYYITNIDATASEDFWRSHLAETTSPQYPMLPNLAYQPHVTRHISHAIPINRVTGSVTTVPSIIRAAWALTLSAYCDSEDVVFGETVAGRDVPVAGVLDMTGPTLATIPVRVQAKRNLTVKEYLKQLQVGFTEAMPYQHMGLQRIKRINSDTATACDFQNLIAINSETAADNSNFWNLEGDGAVGTEFYTYALTIQFDVNATEIQLTAHFDPEVVPDWHLRRLIQYFDCVMTRLISKASGSARLGDMQTISTQDESSIKLWNTASPRAVDQCIHDWILSMTSDLPTAAPAIFAWDAQFTYQELEAVATSFACYLMEIGIGPQSYVPICFEKSAVPVVVMLAVLKIGAAFVPIDGGSPKARLESIVSDVDAKIVLCSPRYEGLCSSLGVKAHAIDLKKIFESPRQLRALPHCASNDIAYLIFTSGSTGKPKGTMVSHAAFASGAIAHAPAMRMEQSSRVLQFSSYTFDASIMEIFTTLMMGACICVPDDRTRLDNVAKAINDMKVDWTLLTPSFVQTISPADISGLKTLVLGGEAVSQNHISAWAEHVHLVNAYGPSECAVVATVNSHVTSTANPSNIGHAVGGHCFIVNQNNSDELVPVGAIGEMVVVGPILARGYLKDRAKTEEAFVRSPRWMAKFQSSIDSERPVIYKTGDLVRYAEDGSLLYVGRKDNQTKLHGQRLELGEVDHHIGQIPSIQHGLATIPSRGVYEKKLVGVLAFKEHAHPHIEHEGLQVIARTDAEPQIRSAKDCLSSRLPPYMVPSNWVLLKDIPLLPSGKLDRRRVKTWIEEMNGDVFRTISGTDSDDNEVQGTEMEQQLQMIWSKVLHLTPQQVGLDRNFIYLGGDSISALQVASQCRSQGLGVTVQDIIRCKSLSELASRVTLPKESTQFSEAYEEAFELSPIQRLFFDWVGEDYQHFNQSIALRMNIRQDPNNVFAAVQALTKSHSMLRARFEEGPTGQWVQIICKEMSQSLRFKSHTGKCSSEVMESVIGATQKSLDIRAGPIIAVNLFESDETESQVLSLVVHHLAVDVVSWGVILDDLENLLISWRLMTEPSLPFQIWSRLQREQAEMEHHQIMSFGAEIPAADYAYWSMTEQGNTYGETCKSNITFDKATTRDLLGPCNKSLQTELVDILLGSILHSFCRTFSDRNTPPPVFNEAHGREPWDPGHDLSRTVGWFTTISPVFLPAEAAQEPDLLSVIRWIKDQRSRTKSNGRPYFAHRMLTEEGRQQSSSHWPIEIAFNYLGQEKRFKKTSSLFEPLDGLANDSDIGASVPRFAIFDISASIADDRLKISLQYPQATNRQDDIQNWVSGIESSVRQASSALLDLSPQPTLSNFPLLPLAYGTMSKIQARLPSIGVSDMTKLEDIYGCSSMQQGLLLSQIKNRGQYMYHATFAVNPVNPTSPVSSERLAYQAVVKKTSPRIEVLQADAANAVEVLESKACISFDEPQPHHRLTICETGERIFCKLELSHAICDGTSIPIIFQDLGHAYASQSPSLGEALRYGDYVAYLRRTSRDEDAAYWRRYLDNIEPCHFPALTDGSKDVRQLRSLELELRDVARIQLFCTQRSITLSTALQFVWALVLRIYTGNENVCFGYLSSGRDVPIDGIENAVGLFISMLVCRMDCGKDALVSDALEQVRDDYAESMSHQAFSLADMQHELQLSGKSLFNTAFTYQRRPPTKEIKDEELKFDVLEAYDPSEYDLTANVEVRDADAAVYFNYWTDFVCDSQAKSISDTFNHVLASLIATLDPKRTIEAIDYCGAHDKKQILEWNRQPLPNVETCVHELIAEQSRILPIRTPAVCSWEGDLTYTKLISLSTRLARQLTALGVGPESYVPICFEKSLWAVVAMLGIMQAGGAFVPLEPTHPESRLKFIISDVNAQLILSSRKHSKKFAGYAGVMTHVVDNGLEQTNQALLEQDTSRSNAANAAYLIFTSGTTGLPKGTIISHQAFATGATEHAPRILMRQDSRVLQFSNLCFDASVMEILTSLMTGACVCIPSDEERMNDISGAIRRMSVNWTLLTPSVAEVLNPESVPSLKVLVTGGEAMQARHIAKWSGKTSLVNAYGPSECAVIATTSIKVDEQKRTVDDDPSVIGHAVGARSWVVNPQDHNQLMPIGSVGELIIEGNTVARGYLNSEEKTAKSFVARPPFMDQVGREFAGDLAKHIYKTGDLVRYRSDGSIIYVSRKDTQIKLNGLRIELGEIEHHVKQRLPENVQSAVEMVAPSGKKRLLAMFFCSSTPRTTESGDPDETPLLQSMSEENAWVCRKLKADLAGALPAYMIPSLFVPLSRMPWTASGKLDRTRLCRVVAQLSREETAPLKLADTGHRRMPTTEMEIRLRKMWEHILNLKPETATLDDSFFVIGGDSLQAMKLVAAARTQKISLSVLDIFRKPTLADMASACSLLEEGDKSILKPFSLLSNVDSLDQILDEVVAQCRVEKDQLADAYPCSALQEGLITLSVKQPGAYVANNVFRLPEAVEIDAFKAAWEKAIQDMDILRTRIVHTSNSTFVQAVLKQEKIEWHTAGNLEDVTNAEVLLPEHSGSPLTRFTLVDNGSPSERYFVWSIHHALYDGWSMPKMLQRVEDIFFEDTPPAPKVSYAQFIKYVSSTESGVADRFWRSKFDGLQSIHFPRVSSTEGAQNGSTDTLNYSLKLPHKAAATGITLPSIIRAAWGILLSAHTGSQDVVFGETMTGRDIPVDGVIDMLGPTLTTVPTRIQLNKSSTLMELLQEVKQMAAEVIPYQHVGMQNIRRLNEDSAMACDFQNLLVIQTAQGQGEASKLWDPQNTGVGSSFFTYPLVVECNADESSIDVDAHYNEHVISKWHVQRLLYQMERILNQLCSASSENNITLGEVQIISEQDTDMIRRWNDYEPAVVKDCIHELFLQQAETIPDAPAVCAWDGDFTYSELSMHADKLSKHLQRRHGVSPEVLVPFCMDKSRWMLVAQMGVLMAGGAIVPLDPAHPVSRHAEIIKDARASLLLCSPAYQERYSSMVETVFPVEEATISSLQSVGGSDAPLLQAKSSNTAYVIFTSGSTGRPKGVVVEHQAFCSSSMAYSESMQMLPDSRVFNFASVTFDVGLMENLSPLTMGATVCVPNNEAKMADLAAAVTGLQATWAFLTPSVANLIEPAAVPSLKTLVCGGEAMSKENVLKWADALTLINGYGPTEAAVISIVNPNTSQEKDSSNIGYAHDNGYAWISDAQDHNRLAPLGCVGELLLGGPILAREYLHDEVKTRAAFIESPDWLSSVGPDPPTFSKIYKTGDLVKYTENGSITFIGRKDNQIKLHGNRIELGEIEHKFELHPHIRHAVAIVPSKGLGKGRLVAALSLSEMCTEAQASGAKDCVLLQGDDRVKKARAQFKEVREYVSDRLPSYMMPAMWIAVEAIPLLVSGKLDRKQVERWIEKFDDAQYARSTANDTDAQEKGPITETVQQLREVYATTFNNSVDEIDPSKSFMSQGGDSLISMSIIARCRKIGIILSLQEILQSKSIFQLASIVDSKGHVSKIKAQPSLQEKIDEPFDLSPVQRMYFELAGASSDHTRDGRFNQSQLLRLTHKTEAATILAAIGTIVQQHSMFRARFSQKQNGAWQQRIGSDASSSYRFKEHHLQDKSEMLPMLAESQTSLNILNGPLFAVELFNVTNSGQILSLVAHHLIIDVVSWNIILPQLEDLLTFQTETVETPLSFQVWNAMQTTHANQREASRVKNILPFNIKRAEMNFWGMADQANTYADVKTESFLVDKPTTLLALGKSNDTLRSQPVEIFLSALFRSFKQVFPQRSTPTIFNESHGRDAWDSTLDLTATTGWFTSIFPLHLPSDSEGLSSIEVLKRVKDLRRSIPSNGRDYFAHRYLTPDGRWRFGDHMPMEILLNYTGQSQQSGQNDSLFVPFHIEKNEQDERLTADVGPKAARMALFEISVGASNDHIHFSFMYNKHMQQQGAIEKWVKQTQTTLKSLVVDLAKSKPDATLFDYPLLPTNYSGLQKHITETFPEVGIKSLDEVEDMYVTAPTQDGLLLSQIRNPGQYINFVISEVFLANGTTKVDVPKLVRAWQKVVDRHQSLRTTFFYSVCNGHAFDQIALKHVAGGARVLHCEDEDFEKEFAKISLQDINRTRRPMLPHQYSICTTKSGKVYCKLELNHAVIDGGCGALIARDLALAYEGRLPDGPKPLYSDYVRYIGSLDEGTGTSFWKNYLHGIERCYLPKLNAAPGREKRLNAIYLKFDRFPELQKFCRSNEFTLSNVMLAAWGLVLRQYTSREDVCFGNLTAGRDAPVDGIQDTVGAFLNMLTCRVKFSPSKTLMETVRTVQSDYLDMVSHQHVSLAKMQHDLGFSGEALFNTAVSIQNQISTRDADKEGDALEIEPLTDYDPTEYAVTVNIHSAPGDEGARIKHWTSQVSVEEGEKLAKTYAELLGTMIDQAHQTIAAIEDPGQPSEEAVAGPNDPDLATMTAQRAKRTPTFAQAGPETEDTASTLEEQPRSRSPEPHAYRNLIRQTVRETIEQLIKSGQLVRTRHGSEATLDYEDHSVHGVDQIDFGSRKSFDRRSRNGSYTETFSYEAMSKTLRDLWSPLLDIPAGKIYDDDSFIALGGDSVLAMELVKATRDVGLSLTVSDIFGSPVFSDMVYCLAKAEEKKQNILDGSDASSDTEAGDIEDERDQVKHFSLLQTTNAEGFLQNYVCPRIGVFRGGIVDAFPVTDFQALAVTGTLIESRWMLNYFTFDGDGALDIGRLKKAAFKLVENFDILRTVFVPSGNRFLQVVLRTLQPQVQVFDTDKDFDVFTTELRNNSQAFSPRFGEPYTQFTILRKIGTRAHRIILRLSHAQYDGICLPIILNSFRAAYEGKDLHRSPCFSSYVAEALSTTNRAAHDYWRGLLDSSAMTEIIPRQSPNYSTQNLIPITLKQTIKLPILTSRNITEATVLKAAWALTLAQLSGNSDIVFGNVISGRNVPLDGVESIVGPCLNIIPVRITLAPKLTALELLRKVQSQSVAGMPYESLGFRHIIQNCTSWPEWAYFSTVVQHQNLATESELCLDRISYKFGAQGTQENLADLSLVSYPKGNGELEIALGFVDDGIMTQTFVQHALDSCASLAQNLVRHPTSSLMDVIARSSISVALTQYQRLPPPPANVNGNNNPTRSSLELESLLCGPTRREITDLADTLARAWRLVLPAAPKRNFILNLESSFYESGGDLISLANLMAWLEGEGWVVKGLEELICRPTMGDMVAMLWKQRCERRGIGGNGKGNGNSNGGSSSETLGTGSGNGTATGNGNTEVAGEEKKETKKLDFLRKGMGVVRKIGGGGKKAKA
ncbi:MAG: hypothetical protein LQ343_004593 [Gyalolechia ehrenbergii]|nr:MAG: hypothetical protein LQ343_004593 [Gyalolechia ehrenbergii]